MRPKQQKLCSLARVSLLIALPSLFASCATRPPIAATGTAQASLSAEPPDRNKEVAQKLIFAGVPNFGEVTNTLYRGAQPTALGFAGLQKLGISLVLNFREENRNTEEEIVTHLGMQYVSIPWDCRHPTNARVAEFLQLVRDNPHKKIFIHCRHGVDRTGLMAAAYRMAAQGWTPAQARAEMDAFGFNYWHRSWCRALSKYEARFPTQLQKDARLHALQLPPTAP